MSIAVLKPRTVPLELKLSLKLKNWREWQLKARDAFRIVGTLGYVMGKVSRPSDAAEGMIWDENDGDKSETEFVLDISPAPATASSLWQALEDRHRKKASTQTALLDKALSMTIPCDKNMVTTINKIRDICAQIFEISTLTKESLAKAIILHALSSDLRMRKEEKVNTIRESISNTPRASPNQRRSNPSNSNGAPIFDNCSKNHLTMDCWSKGGEMEGRRSEVLKIQAERQKQKKANTLADKAPKQGKSFAVRDASGNLLYLTQIESENEVGAITQATTSHAELETIYANFGSGRRNSTSSSEFSMLTDDARVSIDWKDHCNAKYAFDPFPPQAIQSRKFTVMSIAECGPFVADTGATVHVSPIKEDFYTLKLITPKRIWGIAGNYITAHAMGDVQVLSGI
ncbi:hypothetical protein CYLTODRAFT_460045 [Cylindrobasidium torrendii FP15055 ss-10]|uniref:Uncharacterized protein n=1 Tax=Cylindrobasidium torrendii FP15055 ss-10 TaxID=1314674 RepID=A0A0D7AS99_9AGAR|nr:hypothetical protein CYLTODRAFT_460045 [Cylindrobasidium torrendii FP15055 ss-10]